MSKFQSPEINAGSMADIAFLLLIFFLVTTTMDTELGILKQLPKKEKLPYITLNERNVLEIIVNGDNKLLLENAEQIALSDLKNHVINFVDNWARTDSNGNSCYYCDGNKNLNSSDHPLKAVISLQSSRNTSYGTYVTVQNEINEAYYNLRNKLSLSEYGITFKELKDSYYSDKNNRVLKEKFENIRDKYPMLISEKEPQK